MAPDYFLIPKLPVYNFFNYVLILAVWLRSISLSRRTQNFTINCTHILDFVCRTLFIISIGGEVNFTKFLLHFEGISSNNLSII